MSETVTIWSKYEGRLPDNDILAYAGATTAFARLTGAGVNGKELLDRLRVITLLERMPVLKKGDWAKGSGKTRRTIRLFPNRIRGLADQIERVSAHSALCPSRSTDKYHSKVFPCLPNILRAYSDWLADKVSVVAKLNAKLSRERSLQQKLVLYLAGWVRASARKYFDEDISLLVTAAYAADGRDRDVSAQALKVLHSPDRRNIAPPRITEIVLDPSGRTIQLTFEL
jgi:hypothetical protein